MLALRVAGELIGHEMGFNMASIVDPVTGMPLPEQPLGDPLSVYPLGRVQAATLDLTTAAGGTSVSAAVTAPDWAVSFSVYAAPSAFGASTVIRITEGPPAVAGVELFLAFADDVTMTKGSGEQQASRFHPCTPGSRMRAERDTGTVAADAAAKVVWVFSPTAA